MIYLDNSATTKQYDEVTELIYQISKENFGNPSSLHNLGFNASTMLKEARRDCEEMFGGNGRVIFTSGGTESDNMALYSTARKMRRRGNRVITTKVEHPAILETCKRLKEDGFEIVYLGVDENGYVDPESLKSALNENTVLVSMMTVNNEVGTIEPVLESYKAVQAFKKANGTNIVFHTDAVQAYGKISFKDAAFDLISVSGHKFHGPKGVGMLYMRDDLKLPAFITGGGQEAGYRSSTENTVGIAGMALASKMAYENFDGKMKKIAEVNDYLRNGLFEELKDIELNGPKELGWTLNDASKRCPSVLNISFHGTRGEVLLHTLEQDEIFISTGSACASNHTGDSHVLQAMSLDHKEIEGAIRFSFSEFNTIEEMDFVIDKVKAAVNRFRKLGTFR